MAKVPVYKGDPATCAFCITSTYPHTHADADTEVDEYDEETPVVQPQRRRERRKAAVVEKVTAGSVARRRGRPYSAENAELLRICECG